MDVKKRAMFTISHVEEEMDVKKRVMFTLLLSKERSLCAKTLLSPLRM
jgi:hypothetical protein